MFTLEYSEISMLMHPSLNKNKILLSLSVTIDHAKNKNKNSNFQSIRNVLKPVHDERVSVKPSFLYQQRSRFLDHQPRFQRNQESKALENIGNSRRFDAQRRSLEKSSPPSPSSRCSCRSHAFEKRSFFHYEEKRAGEDRKK